MTEQPKWDLDSQFFGEPAPARPAAERHAEVVFRATPIISIEGNPDAFAGCNVNDGFGGVSGAPVAASEGPLVK